MQRLTVMLNSRDHAHHHSLATEVLSRARRAHLAGATLLHAVEGHGRSGALHRQHLFAEDVPLAILIVDDATKIEAFLEDIRPLIGDSVVVLDDVVAFRA
jgi:PII-like signaling protein